MKYIYLIAWREYAENARTKGFWLGLLLVPAIIFISIQVPLWLQKKGTPVRYYVLVDQSGSLAPVIESRLNHAHQKQVLAELNDYARKHLVSPSGTNGVNPPTLDQFMSQGGEAGYLEKIGRAHV